MSLKELIAMKKVANNVKTKDIVRELKITNSTWNRKIDLELITLKEIKALKKLLVISNAELVGIFG